MEYLKVGDVINIENGMTVKTLVPDKFIYSNRKLSKVISESVIVVGEKFYLNLNENEFLNIIHSISKRIISSFSSDGYEISETRAFEIASNEIKFPYKDTFVFEGGEFVVIKTEFGGGGTGMGDHDVYPNGHEVFCKRLIDGVYHEMGHELSFYEDGSFTTTSEKKILPIRKLTPKQSFS